MNLIKSEDYERLRQLEERAFAAGQAAGEYEAVMWAALAEIRDSGLWRLTAPENEDYTFREYLAGWLLEFYQRLPAERSSPYSLRHALKVLSVHRRLVRGIGMDEKLVLTAKPDVMDTLVRHIGRWDSKTGELIQLSPAAEKALNERFPDLPVQEQIRMIAGEVAQIPRHSEAIAYIKETFAAPPDTKSVVDWVVREGDYPTVSARVTEYVGGAPSVVVWYTNESVWPGWLVEELVKQLHATLMPN